MSLEIDSDAGTETVRDEAENGVRKGLGERLEQGSWQLVVKRLPEPRAILVELTNRDGVTRHWVVEPGDPIGRMIRAELEPSL